MASRSAYRFVERKDYQPTEEVSAQVKLPSGASPIVPAKADANGQKEDTPAEGVDRRDDEAASR